MEKPEEPQNGVWIKIDRERFTKDHERLSESISRNVELLHKGDDVKNFKEYIRLTQEIGRDGKALDEVIHGIDNYMEVIPFRVEED